MSWAMAVTRFCPAAWANSSTSKSVGGSPVRSKLIRRIKVRGSAGGAGVSPAAANFARMNWSMSVCTQWGFRTGGGATSRGGWKAQCWRALGGGSVAAPAANAARMKSNVLHPVARNLRAMRWAPTGRMDRRIINANGVDHRLGCIELEVKPGDGLLFGRNSRLGEAPERTWGSPVAGNCFHHEPMGFHQVWGRCTDQLETLAGIS